MVQVTLKPDALKVRPASFGVMWHPDCETLYAAGHWRTNFTRLPFEQVRKDQFNPSAVLFRDGPHKYLLRDPQAYTISYFNLGLLPSMASICYLMKSEVSESMTISDEAGDPFSAAQAKASVTSEWDPINQPPIEGLVVTDVKNVIYKSGVLTEIYRSDWFEDFPVRHIVHVSMMAGETTQWHCHKRQRDIVFPVRGQIRIGFFDSRPDSPSNRKGCVLNFNLHRPRYVNVPPGVWHSLKNVSPSSDAAYIVVNDIVYEYDQPDDWTLAKGASEIPVSLD